MAGAGEKNKLVTLIEPVHREIDGELQYNEVGEPIVDYTPRFKIWVSITPGSAREFYAAEQEQTASSYTVRMSPFYGLNTTWRLKYMCEIYNITGIITNENRTEWILNTEVASYEQSAS